MDKETKKIYCIFAVITFIVIVMISTSRPKDSAIQKEKVRAHEALLEDYFKTKR